MVHSLQRKLTERNLVDKFKRSQLIARKIYDLKLTMQFQLHLNLYPNDQEIHEFQGRRHGEFPNLPT